MNFQHPPPGYSQQAPGPQQQYQNSPQPQPLMTNPPQPLMSNPHAALTAGLQPFQYQMRPSYHQNIAIYANQAGVQWHPQGVPHHPHFGYGYHNVLPNYIPNQSQNLQNQTLTTPSSVTTVAPTVEPSVSTKDIPPGTGAHPMVT